MGYHTGVRSGIVREDTIHIAGPTRHGTLCGKRRAKWGFGPMSLQEAEALIKRQGGRLCAGCMNRLEKLLG